MDTNTTCYNPSLILGNCQKFAESWKNLQNKIPSGTKGNAYPKLNPPPYGVTPLATPRLPYEPLSASLTRTSWEGWRYGSNYVTTDGVQRAYGFPDYTYYRDNYCGPCCPCVAGTNPPLLGDPNGKNPNIRYIQFDYKNLLGSGFAYQEQAPTSQTSPFGFGMMTSGGQCPCPSDSCGNEKKEQTFKFQVCIGDGTKANAAQPRRVQPMKIYLPLSVIPKPDPDEDNTEVNENDCGGSGDAENTKMHTGHGIEVYVPGQEKYKQKIIKCSSDQQAKSIFDPCGDCNACKKVTGKNILKNSPCWNKLCS